MIAGEPIVGMRTNGMTRLPRMAPVVFTPSSSPDSEPAVPRSSRRSSDAVGKASPITIVTGSTVSTAEPNSTPSEHQGLAGSSERGCEITRIRPATLSTATAICETAKTRTGSLIRGRNALKSAAPSAMPMRNRARITVKT